MTQLTTCRSEGCKRINLYARGLCTLHFSRLHKLGILGEAEPRKNISEIGSKEFGASGSKII